MNEPSATTRFWSLKRSLVFAWTALVVLQQVQRLFLLRDAWAIEPPSPVVLAKTLATGFLADLLTATLGVVLACLLAGAYILGALVVAKCCHRGLTANAYRRAFIVASISVGVVLLAILTVDTIYYGFGQRRLDLVFFEFLDDFFSIASQAGQAAEQASAEVNDRDKWLGRLLAFLLFEAAALVVWWEAYRRKVAPALLRWKTALPTHTGMVFVIGLAASAAGFHPQGPYAIKGMEIASSDYDTLAQNTLLFAREPFRAVVLSRWNWWSSSSTLGLMPAENAIEEAQRALGAKSVFPYLNYPLVRESGRSTGVHFVRPVNVVVIFVEGLDRRYVGRTVQTTGVRSGSSTGIALTPFFDRLKQDSLYYENFFTNGVQTSRGLFATLCSSYPRYGTAMIKTRSTNDFLCLPSVLRDGGYRTEMIVSQGADVNNLSRFFGRNGVDRFFSEADFPKEAERLGIGMTDGALLDFVRGRIETMQRGGKPFFLAALTSGTHHPFLVPSRHPEVADLAMQSDGYLAALRYFDLEFERVFTGLREQGLLKNTIVVVLGDHGRHESVGRTETERQAGHFMSPLVIWLDESLRSSEVYRPRVVKTIASQVDLVPTLLAVNGLLPEVAPFMGRDLSCTWSADCEDSNWAFLSSVYDDLIGLADNEGLWLYLLRERVLVHADLSLTGQGSRQLLHEPDVNARYTRMVALHVSSNILLERNRIWNRRNLEEAP